MTGLTKSYLAVLLLLGAGLALVLVDGAINAHSEASDQAVALAGLPANSLAVPYFEPRWRMLYLESGDLFPGMRPLSTMDFVYAQ